MNSLWKEALFLKHVFNEDFLASSDQYQDTMESVILPWLKQRVTEKLIQTADNRPLFCASYTADVPVGTVVIVHGFTENAYKYSELIYSLLQHHYSVLAYDQRGHGRSWRDQGVSDLSVTHVERFDDYVSDLGIVCDSFLPTMPRPVFVFAHSMGGAVTALFLEKYPDVFQAAVLCAPMIAPNTSGIPVPVVEAICGAARLCHRGRKNPFFLKPWSGPEDFSTSCATDKARFDWYNGVKTAREQFHNSIPSYGWTRESVHVTARILAKGAPERISCPVVLFTADDDNSVLPEPQKAFISRVSNGRHVFVPGSRHEIFRSTDDVLYPWWHQVLSFLNNAAGEYRKGSGKKI